MRKQMLLTKEIRKALPPLYAHEKSAPENIPVPLKVFNPYGQSTWFLYEFDGEDTFFGLCCIHEAELGYVSLKELESCKIGRFGWPLERDKFWNGTLADAKEEAKKLGF
jgi:hypothetical protein